jgi:LacI family transcriptional regulator
MATIKDVARLAGVGLGTASRVVSGKGSVSAATAERVRRAIDALEFHPSHAARALLSGTSQMIGVYIPILKGTFYATMLQTIHTELRANGQHMVVAFGSGNGDARAQTIEGMEFLVERGCDGQIVMANALLEEDVVRFAQRTTRFAILNQSFGSIREQCFCVDHRRAGRLAGRALLEQGHRRFALISGPSTANDNVARVAGFMAELQRNGVDARSVLSLESDFSPEGGLAAARKLLESPRKFTALFCANDEMAIGAMSYFHQVGIAIPKSLSVLGYDDTHTAEYSAPRLTSVHIPWHEATLNALRWLLNECYQSQLPVKRKFPIDITWRDSVARASRTRRTAT